VLITFSAGVAERAAGESQEASITRADSAMYEAKHSGKNPRLPGQGRISGACEMKIMLFFAQRP